jgi:hypothetical protein
MKYQHKKMPKNKKFGVKRNRARSKMEHRFSLQRLNYINGEKEIHFPFRSAIFLFIL